MPGHQHVYLVPGFFGFTAIGSLNYFQGVADLLGERLRAHGVDAVIHECETNPTGSIRRRALQLLEDIEKTGGLDADGIHLIGHSTGGLDARLVATPGVQLVPGDLEARIGERLRSIQSLSTPHYGTPLGGFFTTAHGRNILYLLTLSATTGPGRYGLVMLAKALSALARADDFIGRKNTVLDLISKRLLSDISLERSEQLWRFLKQVSGDQGAVIQLTPESMDLFNAAVHDREGTRYVCHISAAPPAFSQLELGDLVPFFDPATRVLYGMVHGITKKEHRSYPYPHPAPSVLEAVSQRLPFEVTPDTNDGIVPSLSQIWGELGSVVLGDHLDVVGQYRRVIDGEKLPGWLKSKSNFNDAAMFKLWDSMAVVIRETSTGAKARSAT